MYEYSGTTRGAQVTGVAVCTLCLTWITFVLRIYVRMAILKFLGREDWLTVAAMIVFTILVSLCLRATYYGLGAHMENIDPGALVTGFNIIFICELLYVVTTTVTKFAIAAYFLRLASRKYQRIVIYSTLSLVLLFSTMYFFFLLFQCGPINYLWEKYDGGKGTCLSSKTLSAVTYAHCAMSALTDWSFGILPIAFVWKVKMNPRTKFSIIVILSLGFFASTATIVRIVYISNLTQTADYSWTGINLVKWSLVEPGIAITAMNIATLRPLFKNAFLFATKRRPLSTSSSLDRDPGYASSGGYTSGPAGKPRMYESDNRSIGNKRSSGGAYSMNEYSAEFAELLGLSRTGVTTHISAGAGSQAERDHMRKKFTLGTIGRGLGRVGEAHESQTELNSLERPSHSRQGTDPMQNGAVDWHSGIKTTTVIESSIT